MLANRRAVAIIPVRLRSPANDDPRGDVPETLKENTIYPKSDG
jgi:hypothetical protein